MSPPPVKSKFPNDALLLLLLLVLRGSVEKRTSLRLEMEWESKLIELWRGKAEVIRSVVGLTRPSRLECVSDVENGLDWWGSMSWSCKKWRERELNKWSLLIIELLFSYSSKA